MKSILLIDDSRTFVRIISAVIETQFKVVGTAHNGNDGFDLYKEKNPDLVLLDITMPNCNGKECLRKIIEYNKDARVIMVSSVGDEETIDECISIGAKGFVNKESLSLKVDPSCETLIRLMEEVMAGATQEAA